MKERTTDFSVPKREEIYESLINVKKILVNSQVIQVAEQ